MDSPVCQACGQESGNERRALDAIARLRARHAKDVVTIRTLRKQIEMLQDRVDALREARR